MRRTQVLAWASALALAAAIPASIAGSTASASTATSDPVGMVQGMPAGAKVVDIGAVTPRSAFGGHVAHGVPNIDSIPNFSGHFNVKGLNFAGQVQNQWLTNFVGNPPEHGGTTTINAPVIPVSVQLQDSNGNDLFVGGNPMFSNAAPFESPVLNSPDFSPATYSSSSTPTEFADAVQRAEFFNSAKADWHTDLNGQSGNGVTMAVPQTASGNPNYLFALNGDGTCCRFILMDVNEFENLLFNAIINAEASGQMKTNEITTFLFPNVYLWLNFSPFICCVLGFHTYDDETGPGGVDQRYVFNYSSWISPGLFNGGLQDVSALSHEMSETFADPFVVSDGIHGLTPWWQSPNGNCQDDMEVGDVIENLPDGLYPVTQNGFTYHPQNEALMQWFDTGTPSNALDGAFSYPNESVLTSPASFQNVGCS